MRWLKSRPCWLGWLLAICRSSAQTGAWTQSTASGPAARYAHTAIFEDRDKTVMIFGGLSSASSVPALEVWQYYKTNNNWQRKWEAGGGAAVNPTALYSHTAVFDGATNMFVHGGDSMDGFTNQLWHFALVNNAWTDLSTTDAPVLQDHSAVWNPTGGSGSGGSIIVFGGKTTVEGNTYSVNTVMLYQDFGGSYYWISPEPVTGPSARSKHSAVYDTDSGVMLVFGGEDDNGNFFQDLWQYAQLSNTWTDVTPTGATKPSARGWHTAVWTGACMLVYGGYNAGGKLTDLYQYCPADASWTLLQPFSGYDRPEVRARSAGAWDPHNDVLVIFGGISSTDTALQDTWIWDPNGVTTTIVGTVTTVTITTTTITATTITTITSTTTSSFSSTTATGGSTSSTRSSTTTSRSKTSTASTTSTSLTSTRTKSTTSTRTKSTTSTSTSLTSALLSTTTLLSESNSNASTFTTSTTWTTSSTTFKTSSSSTTFWSTTSVSVSSSSTTSSTSSSQSHTSTWSSSSSITATSSTASSTSSTTSTTSSQTSTQTTSTSSSLTRTETSSSSSTTSTSSLTSTTSSTTLYELVVVPDALNGTLGGQIVSNSLQVVIESLGTTGEVRASTSTGEVTVLKLQPNTTDAVGAYQNLQVTTQQSGQMPVLLPTSALENVTGNSMLVVTELAETVVEQLPQDVSSVGEGSSSRGFLSSHVVEISLAAENSGTVVVAEVQGLNQPVYFRIRESDALEGDICVFFDSQLGQWSSAGTSLATSVPGQDNALNGTWCQTSHFSLFAVMQTIDTNSLLPDGSETSAAAGAIAVASLIVCGLGLTVMCFLVKRRLQRPVKGQAHIRDARGGTRKFDWSRSKLMAPVESTTSAYKKPQKILVKWHLNPDSVAKQINRFDGLRHFSVDLQPAAPPMVHETSVFSTKVSKTKSLRTLSENKLDEEVPPDRDDLPPDWPMHTESVGIFGAMPPAEVLEKLSPIVPDIPKPLDRQAYEDGEEVLYHSETHGRVLPAAIVGGGYFYTQGEEEELAWPLYNCKVGVKLREMVPMSRLRAPLDEGSVVCVMGDEQWDGTRTWSTGHILDASAWKMTHLVSYPTYDILLSDGSKCKASFEKIRRRFDTDQLVEVYMGRRFGWVYGTAAEALMENWGSSSESEEPQTIQVVLVRDELAVTVPSFLVRSRPAITARI